MIDALYVAASGMNAVERLLETSSHNTVNSQTPGYQHRRAILENFGAFLDGAQQRADLIGARETLDFAQGDLRSNESPTALALEGPGFFVVRSGGNDYLTRNGDFRMDLEGQLVTRAGYPLVGSDGSVVRLNPDGGAPRIEEDGAILQDGAEVGRIRVVELTDDETDQLTPAAETLYGIPKSVNPSDASQTFVRQGFLEMPPFAMKSLVEMLVANRNYESMQRAVRTIDRVTQTTLRSV